VEFPCAPGGEAQDGGAAHAGVGDEDWAALLECGAWNGDLDLLDGNAGEFA
jgi:hypothetical protein